jgi:hypothetical protein
MNYKGKNIWLSGEKHFNLEIWTVDYKFKKKTVKYRIGF